MRDQTAGRRILTGMTLTLGVLAALMTRPGATAAEIIFYPAEDRFGTLLFEDMWPSAGDIDFNDVVLRYNVRGETDASGAVFSLVYVFDVTAIGAGFVDRGLALHLPVPGTSPYTAELSVGEAPPATLSPEPGESNLVLVLAEEVRRDLCGGATGFVNTEPGVPEVDCPSATLAIDFPEPTALDLSYLPFDLFFFRSGDHSHQTHLPTYGGTDTMDESLFGTEDDASVLPRGPFFVSSQGIPWVVNIPESSYWPWETVPIDNLFPEIVGFWASGGTENQDWYLHPNPPFIYRPPVGVPAGSLVAPVFALLVLLSVVWIRSRR